MYKRCLLDLLPMVTLFSGPLLANSDCTSCDCHLPETPIENQQCPAGYNRSAAIQVSNRWGGNDLSFNASYLYWYAGEEGLDLGRSGEFITGDDPFFTTQTTLLSQSFEYQSGFKVGAGWGKNDWVLSGEYTWIRNSTSQNSFAPVIDSPFGTGVWLIAPWFVQLASDGGSLSGTEVLSKWHLGMDIADLTLSRPYYQGRYLTLLPFAGLRGAWIRQKMNITLFETPGIFPAISPQPIHSFTASNSWSIGPRLGTEAHLLLTRGFKVEADVAVSLLFTEYTKVSHREDPAEPGAFPASISAQIKNRSALRPVLECGLGLGWGSYLYSNRYYIDFSAKYDFNFWWDQNMMRHLMSNLWNEVSTNGDLYLHGLTLSADFHF